MSYAKAARIEVDSIPVIDLENPLESALEDAGNGEAITRVGHAMLAAAEDIGFFYIRNHGIPAALIADVLRVAGAFFAEPMPRKQTVAVATGHRGFIRMGEAKMAGSARPDLKESFVWGLDHPGDDGIPPNQWPGFMPEMRTVLTTFFDAGNAIGWHMLRAFAAALDIAPDRFVRTIDRPISRGSVIYYPPQAPDMGEQQFGVSPHTDYGCLTLLHQDDTGGLQVQGRDGIWLMADPIPDTFVVNVGDLLARWTNDRFRSTPHRVVNQSGRTRLSTAIFVDPNRDTLIDPVLRPGEAPRYPPVTCGDYLRSRLDAAFAYRKAAGA